MIPYNPFLSFFVGPIEIQVWGLFVAAGIVLGLWLARKEAKRRGIEVSLIENLTIVSVIGTFIGARVFYVIYFWQGEFAGNPLDALALWKGGLVSFGGFLGGPLAAWLYLRYKNISFTRLADVAAPAIILGYMVGRMGCFAIHDHIGKLMNYPWPWGIQFTDGVRHEAALYSIIASAAIFIVLWLSRRKLEKVPGAPFSLLVILYTSTRFVIDFFRADDLFPVADPRIAGLTYSQYVAAALFLISIYVLSRLLTAKRAGE